MPSSPSSPMNPLGRREHRKAVTRMDLLVAGRRLFSRRGLYDARIEDLARDAGIAKGTVYGYFRNKEALIEAVAEAGLRDLRHSVERRLARVDAIRDPACRVAEAHFEFFAEHPDLLRVLHQVRGMLKFRARGWRRLRRPLEDYLAWLEGALGRRGERNPARARHLFGAVSGIASLRAAMGDPPASAAERAASARAVSALVRSGARVRRVQRGVA